MDASPTWAHLPCMGRFPIYAKTAGIYIYIYIHIHSQCCARHGDRPGGEGGLAGELLPAALPVPGNDNINNHNTRNLPIPGTTSRVREDFPAMG